MVLHLVCECGNDINVSENRSEAIFRCPRCGRTLAIAGEEDDRRRSEGETELFLAGGDSPEIDETPRNGSILGRFIPESAPPDAEEPFDAEITRITVSHPTEVRPSSPTLDLSGDKNADVRPRSDKTEEIDHSATKVFDSLMSMGSDEDFEFEISDRLTPDEDETKLAEPPPGPSKPATDSRKSGSRIEGSSAGSLDLSQRVMDTLNRPSRPLGILSDSGHYGIHQVLRTHQKGGMGRILIAYDQYLKRDVALKELHPEVVNDPSIVRRFIGEAEITAQLEHPGIVPIHTLSLDTDGNPYYTMKLIKGHTLQDAIKAYHRNPSRQDLMGLVRRLVSICKTMSFAHQRGVIHRDLKPANIMLGEHGETLVMDWGLAKPIKPSAGEESSYTDAIQHQAEPRLELTMVGAIVGTPAFMSPEQASPETSKVGPHSDIFSLGTILYYLLAGQTAFSGRSTQEVLKKVRAASPPRPSEIKSNVPRGLEAICAKAMAKRPENRYSSASEMDDDLCRWLDGEPVLAQQETFFRKIQRWVDKNRLLSISIPLILVLLIVLTNIGIYLDRVGRDRVREESVRRVLEESVDLTDQNDVTISASPGIFLTREPRKTGGDMIECRVETVPESRRAVVEIRAPASYAWDLDRRSSLSFMIFEESDLPSDAVLANFHLRLGRGSAYFEYCPDAETWLRRPRGKWHTVTLPLDPDRHASVGESEMTWTRTEAGDPLMARVEWIEFHFEVRERATFQIDKIKFQGNVDDRH